MFTAKVADIRPEEAALGGCDVAIVFADSDGPVEIFSDRIASGSQLCTTVPLIIASFHSH